MAGLEALTAMIYHERQQEGSMLCAQHALNSLLQGNYFTAPDLASIANSFDALEQDAFEGNSQRAESTNMDDTGFFSVQVIDKALDVWGLNLIRWRSEQMRPYQASPHTQLAFVLNLHQHWFTLRRFGHAQTDPATDPGEGHWFNLNSQYMAPKWVSRTYLGMFLQQSEEEGYSVFAVVQADPSHPLALPRTEADLAAATLEAPDSLVGHSSMPGSFPASSEAGEVVIPDDLDYDVNNEDVELQAALAASLTGGEYSFGQHAYVPQAPVPAPRLRQAPAPPEPRDDDDDDEMDVVETPASGDVDPVAASLARNRAMLERMTRMQEAALRESYEDEAAGTGRQPSQRRRTQMEEEHEEIRRAIAASMAETGQDGEIDEDDGDEEWRPEGDKENIPAQQGASETPASASAVAGPTGSAAPPTAPGNRVYDDEDAQLQAALRASLESMPEGFVHPPTPPRNQSSILATDTAEPAPSIPTNIPTQESLLKPEEVDEGDSVTEQGSSPPPPPAQVDVDEMRRRRLARFGG